MNANPAGVLLPEKGGFGANCEASAELALSGGMLPPLNEYALGGLSLAWPPPVPACVRSDAGMVSAVKEYPAGVRSRLIGGSYEENEEVAAPPLLEEAGDLR